jgi:hypothetical protein
MKRRTAGRFSVLCKISTASKTDVRRPRLRDLTSSMSILQVAANRCVKFLSLKQLGN